MGPESQNRMPHLQVRVRVADSGSITSLTNISRTRRLKCDEAKPECERCVSGGLTCSGFGYGSPTPASVAESKRRNEPLPMPRLPSGAPQINGTSEIRDLLLIGPMVASKVFYSHSSDPGDTKMDYLVGRMRRLSSYIYHIPARSGRSSTLDNAVGCCAMALRTIQGSENRLTDPKAWYMYGEALRELRGDLQSAERSLLPETLCATELLSYFEVSCTHCVNCSSS